ncbi:disease resistance protein RPV1 [Lactuca sativa]|uniref:TIR domain-containing protein n=1 Tax=Lactuca sativa TaxID=4236 RepID=A0A9R1VDX9_LACSA|nr:disease resistance protein RPV1 [Lactuca sativa]XP_023767546.1 disease resistance protein RPV1 [Lactuca sativa]XP_042758446.1 disease resistance protein RPV1 [Lactuca sativa]XP_052620220.1 disease resistance protein RPV1 [Lactuca sativa]XP_052620221.1 disease resistance protein RPV1 [Lactuca sativa]KAJ0204586.1 hypothetical protein LSAT_V11C500243360 [Lactuca sativa]
MASSSTSSIYKSFKYDVFLSFRGEDTRTNFVDHLYYALQQKNIHTYKDDERIKKGKRICDELIRSIEDSKLYIIVFSKNYASSSWCLDELVKIMECHKTNEHTAYPVFYDLEPSEVRKQSGAVEKAFAKHENEEAAGKWREALKDAADLAGWELKKTVDGHEAKFIQKIVEVLSLELRAINFNIDEKLVGMETRMNDVLSSLGTCSNDVRMIGIKGIGGGGKTTLARAVFDQISFQFEGKSFVENVREVSKASLSGLKSLQNQILSDVLNDQGISVSSVYDGKNMMKRRMPGKKVLLVLDDVDHIEQLEALAGETNWFKPGSRIIITTRDEQVLVAHGVKSIHNVRLLLDEEAICLFSRYAFGRVIQNLGYEELSQQVVHYAAGLPLTLKVLGSFLRGKNELEWTDALERLKIIPLMETLKKLEISYDDLEEDYKEIFLNVASILKGWSKASTIKALESCGFHARNGLRVLEQKSLITVDNVRGEEYLSMHDHIEEMGRNIIRRSHPDNPNKHSRLWINKEIVDILANDLGTEATRYIQLYTTEISPQIVMKGLRKMKELRFLHVSVGSIDASKIDCFCSNLKFLRYLCWNHYPFRSLPKTFQADNLVALYMTESRIVQLWEGGERKLLNKLRFLDLSYSMLRTLDLGLTPNIEMLNLKACHNLVEVHMIGGCLKLITVDLGFSMLRTLDLGSAPNIERLDLEHCSELIELRLSNICLNLRSLKLNNLKLRNLDIGLTPCLEYLDLKECYNLVELHMADECLKKLVYLDLSGCLRFKSFKFEINMDASCSEVESLEVGPLAELHLSVGPILVLCPVHPDSNLPKFQFKCFYREDQPLLTRNLEKLISVGMCVCTNLYTFSRSICGLQRLKKLKLHGGIPEAPRDLGQLEYLEQLDLSHTHIKHLPDSICMLKNLKSLKLKSCVLLEKLPEDLGRLECLKKLTVTSAMIKDVPESICMLKQLESLKLSYCSFLEKLPEDLGQLECLKKLDLSSTNIKGIPDSICMLKDLESLDLSCVLLEKLPEDLGQLEYLDYLDLSYCKFLQDIPDSICQMKCLTYLWLCYSPQLKKLPEELGTLEWLKYLDLRGTCISHLPQSILLWKGLCITTGKVRLDLSGPYCYVRVSKDDFERLRRPGKKAKIN